MQEKELACALRIQKKGPGRRTWRCPDDAVLAAYADTFLDETGRQRVENHLAECDFCLEQVAFLARAQGTETPTDVPRALLARAQELGGSRHGTQWALVPRWGLVATATASLALAAGLWLGQPESVHSPSTSLGPPPVETVSPPAAGTSASAAPVPPPAVRNRARPAALPAVVFPQEGAVIPPDGAEFRWQEVDRSLFYEIRLVTANGSLLWEQRVEATHARLPADLRLAAGQKYFVWIRAYLQEGKTLKSSTVGFTVDDTN